MVSKEDDDQQEDPQPTKFGDILRKWPKQTFLILSNEFCERFSFYGMRAVLTLYFVNILHFNSSTASVFFHAFAVVSYASPILGSILADGYIGKFWTIFTVSIFYAAGQIVLALVSIASADSSFHPWFDILGLFIIGLGTGGIKPCVSSFGGDQFPPHYTKMISIFFSIFYFSINAGSLISMWLTPYFRAVPCLGHDSCYPLAFGIPALLMIVATVVFMAGSFSYKKYPPKENVIFRVVSTITKAIRNRASNSHRKHWLEHSLDEHDCSSSTRCHSQCDERKFIEDVKRLLQICIMMSPLPMFWALFDQQGSTWVIQAVAMDARITSNWTLLPDQMGSVNALLILLFIPLFQSLVYPLVEKCGINLTLLRKMAAGGILTGFSFIVCGIVQLFVNKSLPLVPADNTAHLTIINSFPTCNFNYLLNDGGDTLQLNAGQSMIDVVPPIVITDNFRPSINFTSDSPNCPQFVANPRLSPGHSYLLIVSPIGWSYRRMNLKKPSRGQGEFAMNLNYMNECGNIALDWKNCTIASYEGPIALCKIGGTENRDYCQNKGEGYFYELTDAQKMNVHDYKTGNESMTASHYPTIDVKPGTYKLFYAKHGINKTIDVEPMDVPEIDVDRMGGVYAVTVSAKSKHTKELTMAGQMLVPNNKVSIIWQIPQYILLTAGEVMFSITGLEFAYREASPQMKSVVQAVYLFTTAIGDLIVVAIMLLNLFSDLAIQMFVFGIIMMIVMVIFILLAVYYYQYAHYDDNCIEEDDSSEVVDESKSR